MGCGKSSVGKRLSELLCCRFMDLDTAIEEREGCSVAEIFDSRGEAEFRRIEAETLHSLLEDVRGLGRSLRSPHHCASLVVPPLPCRGWHGPHLPHTLSAAENSASEGATLILALGGGAVMTPECGKMVHEQTVCVYLKASVDELVARLSDETAGRPLLSGRSSDPSVTSSEVETSPLRTRILELMEARSETYERTAHIIIDTDGKSIDEVADEIIRATCRYTAG